MEQATLRRRQISTRKGSPPGSNAPALVQGLRYVRDPLGFLSRYQERYGDIFTVRFPFFGQIVYVAGPDLVKEVFTGSPAVFHAGEANAIVLEPALGPSSVLTLDDEAHMRQRKLLLPPFHGESVRRYGELIEEVTQREMETWPVGEPFELRRHTQRITLAVILRAVFGITDELRIDRATRLIDEFSDHVTTIIRLPFLRRDLGPGSPWRRFVCARKALDDFIFEEIVMRRAEGDEERGDVLSLLLRARHDDGSPMSDSELRDELVTVVGAGHETTATTLAWAIERLLRNPHALGRLRGSIATGQGDYLEATVRETLRVRPVIVDVARKLTAPATVGGYELPAGTFVAPAIASLHQREDVYPQPQEFRPERFLDSKAENYAWIPFGGGVRRCIGAAFAEFEMRIVLREFVSRAALSAPDPAPEKVKIRNITLAPEHGARVVLERQLTRPDFDFTAAAATQV
jgi:cytochrome P450